MTKSLCVVSPHSGMFGPAEAGQDCGSCYQLDLGTVVGIIAGDLIVTLLIVLSVFCFVINQRRRRRSTLNCHEETAVADLAGPSCYRIEPGTIAGIVLADVGLTIGIVLVTYHCARRRRRRQENADKIYMNVRANCKT